ncbi:MULTISPECIES: AAA family ATPase [unclassified Acinetobacter]|uniref:AAA family ATPase n=1 Tax=unclassified Acinetobacter TaxID=196816 RepID=UPI0015D39F8D|nr:MULTISPECIES: AAA family ATPase [unclassified Acinetobacter]
MSSIFALFFKGKVLQLDGKNLIITGNNGAGKTRFLNNLANDLTGRNGRSNSERREKLRHELISLINYGVKNFHSSLDFQEEENKHLNEIFLQDIANLDFVFTKELTEFQKNLNYKYSIFQKKLGNFSKTNNLNLRFKNYKDNQKNFYYSSPEHIHNYVREINHLSNSYLSNQKLLEVVMSLYDKNNIFFFDAARVPRMDFSLDVFKTYDDFLDIDSFANIEGALEAYLVRQKSELIDLMKFRTLEGTKIRQISKLEKWFIKVESDLKWIFENKDTKLSFTQDGNKVLIKQEENSFSFDQLSSGFKAIFNIYTNLLMRAQIKNLEPENLIGIAIIDEIDVHLHISLQKKILPFLIKAFPKIQFIVSTHSPFVITSENSNTVVFDLTTNELIEKDLSRYSYESIIKGLFHVEIQSKKLESEIKAIAEILNNEPNSYEKLRNILKNIAPFSKQLDVESKSFYFKALNHLVDNQELGELDV